MIASTVVVIGREAFSPTEETVRRIVAHTPPPRRLVVVDGNPRLEDFGTRMHQPVSVVGELEREPTELVELHCLLARRECLELIAPFDESFVAGREETDLSLLAARRGWTALLEPAVVVGSPSPKRLSDRDDAYYLPRWSDAWSDRSFRAFHRKWGLGDDATGERFRTGHRARRIGRWPGTEPGWRGPPPPARVAHTASWDTTGPE